MIIRIILTAFILTTVSSSDLFASYKDALKLYQEKKYNDSLKMIAADLATADDATGYKLRFLAAHNHWRLGSSKNAINHFTRCMAIQKNSADPYIDTAFMLIENNNYAEAETFAYNGLKVKKDAMLYYVLGKIYLAKKNYHRAKDMFERANAVNQDIPASYNGLGIALMNMKKYGEANTAFSIALAINPDSPELLNNMGMSYEKMENYKEAVNYYSKAESADKNNKIIAANLKRAKDKK